MPDQLDKDVSLQRVVESAGVTLRAKGKALVGTCPFHPKAKPALTIDTKANTWSCPTCRVTAGTVVDWVMKAQGVSRRHAMELLRSDYGAGTTKPVKHSTSTKLPDAFDAGADDAALLGRVVEYYADSLKRTDKAGEFMTSLGIGNAELVERFKVGFSDRSLGYRIPKAN